MRLLIRLVLIPAGVITRTSPLASRSTRRKSFAAQKRINSSSLIGFSGRKRSGSGISARAKFIPRSVLNLHLTKLFPNFRSDELDNEKFISLYDIIENMKNGDRATSSKARLQVLAEFRHQLRLFLHFSEAAAARFDLQPQQHQLLLQIAGRPEATAATVGYVAERLGLRHNSVVELSMRCEEAGLIRRTQDGNDRRCVLLELTPKGLRTLEALSLDHARELNELAPQLIRTLTAIKAAHNKTEERAWEE
jgi:DNA-binding MarR family transcriptional regulator